MQRQKLVLAEKLRQNRASRSKKLEQEQEEDKEDFLRRSDRISDSGDLVEVSIVVPLGEEPTLGLH